jgi:hypothetical protein
MSGSELHRSGNSKQRSKPSRLEQELKEMGEALHRLGALSDDEYAQITLRGPRQDRARRTSKRCNTG